MLSYELSTCHETISTLKGVNNDLNAKLEVANKSNSCVEHVMICTRCKDFDIDACSEHLVTISKLNDELASLNAQLKTSKSDFDKLKFARDAYSIGRHPSIKDGLGFKRLPSPPRRKGRPLWLVVLKRTKLLCIMTGDNLEMLIGVIMHMMLLILMPCLLLVLPMCMIEMLVGEMLFIICLGEMLLMFLGKLMNLLQYIMLAMLLLPFIERVRR
jgi:hypothetical protein